ncbi:MAG: hypothetical protein ACO1OO_16855 [Flavisolibacter sp.]
MKFERSDVKFPLWRKKVDSSLFNKAHTPIPNWCAKAWDMKRIFGTNTSKKNSVSHVQIKFEKQFYEGRVTYSLNKDTDYQIYLAKDLVEVLKDRFVMSYMRSLEQRLRKGNDAYKDIDLEEELSFWEFIDIEFDHTKKVFLCKAHYHQRSIFPELFKQIIRSHHLKEIENQLLDKGSFKFIKQDWTPRSEFKKLLERRNIIYYLIDTKNCLLYIGEAEHTKRISQARDYIPNWDYFRIDGLPEWLTRNHRLELERLIIRSFASILINNRQIKSKHISNYKLVNRKIDR